MNSLQRAFVGFRLKARLASDSKNRVIISSILTRNGFEELPAFFRRSSLLEETGVILIRTRRIKRAFDGDRLPLLSRSRSPCDDA